MRSSKSRPPIGAVLLVLGLLGLCGWETGATLIQHYGAPRAKDWQSAAAKLRTLRQRGEPLLFAPHWVDPLGRQAAGDQVDLELLLLSDVDRFSRVWQMSVRGANHPLLKDLAPAERLRFGAVTVSRFDKPAEEVLLDFTRSVRRATVERAGERVVRCPWEKTRFACDPVERWNWVGPHLAEVGHRPYRCIYAHPADRQVMRITYSAVPLGNTLVVYTGIDDFENRKRSKKSVLLRVKTGEELLGQVEHRSDWPWHRLVLDTRARAGKRVPVRFEVTAEGAYARTFCFAAEARR
jgi:hypothetical protein